MKAKRVLVVDDEPPVCLVISRMLDARGYDVVALTEPDQTLQVLRRGHFDAVLLDLVMPGVGGLDLLRQIRAELSLPVLVVTGDASIDRAVEAMRRGASDFVTKPVDADLLDLRIRRAFDLERARQLASTDGLTGLYNHRSFQERLGHELDRATRYDRPLTLLMADLDHFKSHNDAYGHPRGDEALIEVAQILREESRSADVVARYGGEEFAIVLPETAMEQASVVAERIRRRIERLHLPWEDEALTRHLTVSIGLAERVGDETSGDLVRRADSALYEAKRRGRNRVCVQTAGQIDPLLADIAPHGA